jgi:hypothetical protein
MKSWQKQEQLRLYREQMGAEAAARQEIEAKKARGACICGGRPVRKKWEGEFSPVTTRMLHHKGCPKHRWWMDEV